MKYVRKGLTSKQVHIRIQRGDTNNFTQVTSRSALSIIRANTLTLFNGIIAGCFIILVAIGHWQDIFFALSAFTNILIGSWQEFNAKRELDKLAILNAQLATVIRDGKEIRLGTSDIVMDDLLVLRSGDEVPADAKVSESFSLQLDQSMLTGESDPVNKNKGDEVLSGSIVVAGTGYAIVNRVGEHSFANRFANEARRFSLVASELRASINKVLKFVAWAIGPMIVLLLTTQIISLGGWSAAMHSSTLSHAVVNTIASIVSMIPLGLVLITSVSFAIGAVKLSRQKVLIKELAAVEGLARVDMICLDKTGTLTEGSIMFEASYPLSKHQNLPWEKVLGWYAAQPGSNATARSLGMNFQNTIADKVFSQIQFSSARKWSAVSFAKGELKGSWVLGGPEIVLQTGHDDVINQSKQLAARGKRTLVLAFAPSLLDGKKETLPERLEPITLLVFQETIRTDAKKTLEYFKDQGVAIRIISGDNPDTVAAIARQVGLKSPKGFDARHLPEDPVELAKVLENNTVFGRVTPEQKQHIVVALQGAGYTVAMTGDGVNDTLAIKQADMGIAMNSGSAAAKAVSRLVLLDGQFSHLPSVVKEGRQVIANIENVSMLFLSKTTYAFGIALLFSLLLLPFPFLPRQESIVDGLTIGIPAFFLALLPNSRKYRPGFLKRSLSFAIPAGSVVALALSIYARIATSMGIDEKTLQTGATLLLIVMGLWILVLLFRPINLIKTLIIGAMMGGLVLVFTIPFIVNFLQFTNIPIEIAALITAISLGAIGLLEVVRLIHRHIFKDNTLVKKKKLAELVVVGVVGYISAYLTLGLGTLVVFARYTPGLSLREGMIVTVVGAAVIMIGFLMISVVSGISRGDRASRIVLTALLSITVVIMLFTSLEAEDITVRFVVIILVIVGTIALLWTGRRRAYFKGTIE